MRAKFAIRGTIELAEDEMTHVLNAQGQIKTDEHVTLDDESVTAAKIANRTRKFFVTATGGWNNTDGSGILHSATDYGFLLPTAKACSLTGAFIIPEDYASTLKISWVIFVGTTGGVVCLTNYEWAACGEAYNAHFITDGTETVNVTQFKRECIKQYTLPSATAGDIVYIEVARNSLDINDTVGDLWSHGWIVEYTADS